MRPTRIWAGLMLTALGVFGVMDVAGVLPLGRTVGEWWPVAIIGWGLAAMLTFGSVSLNRTIVVAAGLALLADEQDWARGAVIWSLFISAVGLAILAAVAIGGKPARFVIDLPCQAGKPDVKQES